MRWWLADRAVPHAYADKPGGTTWERDRPHKPGFRRREIKSQNLCKNLWELQQQEKLPASQESSLRDPQGPRTYTTPPIQESAPEGPSLLVGSGGSD